MTRIEEIEARMAAIPAELETATGDALTALESEVASLTEERSAILAEIQKKQELRAAVAAGEKGTKIMENTVIETTAERAAQEFVNTKHMSMNIEETRSAILTSGNIAKPTEVKGINDIVGAKVSSIIDLCKVVNCEGMGTNRVAYIATDIGAADAQTEGSAATEKEPTFNYVDITPTSVAVYSQISKQVRKQSPLNYKGKVQEQALLALRKKAAALVTAQLKASSLNQVVYADEDANHKGVVGATTLRDLVLNYGGDEGINTGILFLNKTDLLAFAAVRGTNEKKAVYKITPDADNPNTGLIEEGGLVVKYCINSGLTACHGTERAASTGADKPTMFYGDPYSLELDLFSNYEIRISEDFAFTSLMDTILGDVELGADVVKKNGFVTLSIKKAS